MEGVCKETVVTACVTHLTLIEGKIYETVYAFLFLLITPTQKISTGLQEQTKASTELGIGKSACPAKGIVLSLELGQGPGGDLKGERGMVGLSSVDRTCHQPIQSQHTLQLHIR